ncbi:hypothetical protein GOZ96_01040 [Agrobacterium vitis]|uniref:Transmemrbane protein n=1 Tax=Agrobacterium vitis TaxID=373 RepID=A0A368NTD9_AGRVI|nr:hypothetical protein DXM22_00725 [Agrobacterium vitis]KAA3532322.1 hypothetical protein DXT89_02995 [Agrobacterium vitis]MCF1475590.1 hypothetical protein [Agrobacterium vitis]MUZ95176.1 hypothetical protein [Agrobacterium vitis]MVA29644.1 hypothetical protein [Agrobacterium vitis]
MRYRCAMIDDVVHTPKPSLVDLLFVLFLRVVALACLWLGLQFWGLLVGFAGDGLGRFDLMNVPWRIASCGLAVMLPVAGVGLWMTVSWGPVIWVIAASGQILMHAVWPGIFGRDPLIVAFHLIVAVVYIAFRLAILLQKRRRATA